MRSFDAGTLDRLDAGEIDYVDGVTFIFDSGVTSMWIGGRGNFQWTDATLGTETFYGGGSLLTLEVPGGSLAGDSAQVVLRLAETYMTEGSDVPVSIWDNGDSPTYDVDSEPWQGREVIVSTFWRDSNGGVLQREQIERLVMDSMVIETNEDGRPMRVVTLERPDIIQRDIEGKTDNAELQRQVDVADLGYEHVSKTAVQKINFGAVPEQSAASATKSGRSR